MIKKETRLENFAEGIEANTRPAATFFIIVVIILLIWLLFF
jgi:hypothetical protein